LRERRFSFALYRTKQCCSWRERACQGVNQPLRPVFLPNGRVDRESQCFSGFPEFQRACNAVCQHVNKRRHVRKFAFVCNASLLIGLCESALRYEQQCSCSNSIRDCTSDRRACSQSEGLGTDHIDCHQMHHVDRPGPREDIWHAMEPLIREGKITHAGSGNFAGWHVATAQSAAASRFGRIWGRSAEVPA